MPENEYVTIAYQMFNPARSLFKQPANAKAVCHSITCRLEACPLRSAGQCIEKFILGPGCPFGRTHQQVGFTRRARAFSKWVIDREAERPETALSLRPPEEKMAFIGEYVYLPYSHMGSCKEVPFLSHSGILSPGRPFVPRDEWTLGAVLALLDHRPLDLMGRVIRNYGRKSIPAFLTHLREEDPGMWGLLLEERPELDKPPDYVGRKALLRTLNSPIQWTTKHDRYPVTWAWDGESLSSKDMNAYDKTWGQVAMDEIEIKAKPKDDVAIVVQDNDWVNERTQFVD